MSVSAILSLVMGNPIVQAVLLALAALIGWKTNNVIQRRKGAKRANEDRLREDADEARRIQQRVADAERVRDDGKTGYRD
jgi:uncharacterized membrane protein